MQLVFESGLHQTRAVLYIYEDVFLYVCDGLAQLQRLYREQYWLTPRLYYDMLFSHKKIHCRKKLTG